MRGFEHLRPTSLAEACALKSRCLGKARFWAGGTDLMVQRRNGKDDWDYAIDLTFIGGLDRIERDSAAVRIGALTRIAAIVASDTVIQCSPSLWLAARQTATPQVRNIATVGGNLCNAAPSADLAVPLLALGATAVVEGPLGTRTLALEEFFKGSKVTALAEGELLKEVLVPVCPATAATAFVKLGRSSIDIAVVNVAVRLDVDRGGFVTLARVVLGAVAPVPMRAREAERFLTGKKAADERVIEEAARAAASETRPINDVRASAAYRREAARVLTRRALQQALGHSEGVMP